jgi:uncharacterized protein
MKLLCDHMLGSLAKWLRILGFDTYYPTAQTSDDEILTRAKQEHRLIISRDKELLARGKKQSLDVLGIHTTHLPEQITQVLAYLRIDSAALLSRCIICNTPLLSVPKDTVQNIIPPKVFETRDAFWLCPSCKKYYWRGTHYENMMKKINILQKKNP